MPDEFYNYYVDHTCNLVPLMIWHVRELSRLEENPVSVWDGLDQYADIYRKTVLWDGDGRHHPKRDGFSDERWDRIKQELIALYDEHEGERDSALLEKECYETLRPYLEPRFEQNSRPLRKGPGRPYGCWGLTLQDNVVGLHFQNAYRPNNPFVNREDLISDLRDGLRKMKKRYPDATTLSCSTWLNGFEPFLEFLPASWRENMILGGDYGWGWGYWGQYMDRRGAFHRRNAESFRRTGKHPYRSCQCSCSVDEALAHLKIIL